MWIYCSGHLTLDCCLQLWEMELFNGMEGDISDDMLCGISQEQAYAMATVEDLSPFAKITTRTFVTKMTTYAHFRREKNKDFINKVYITVPCLPAKYQ